MGFGGRVFKKVKVFGRKLDLCEHWAGKGTATVQARFVLEALFPVEEVKTAPFGNAAG